MKHQVDYTDKLLLEEQVVSHFDRPDNMQETIITLWILVNFSLINAQTLVFLTVKQSDSDNGIKNVNVIIPNLDTTLVTDTAGIVDLCEFQNFHNRSIMLRLRLYRGKNTNTNSIHVFSRINPCTNFEL